MARFVLLDSSPLGLAAMQPLLPPALHCRAWLRMLEASGAEIMIPAIADYEVRRELLRLRATVQLRNLDGLRGRFDYLPVNERAWDVAASFWALLRNAGIATSGPQDLDADAILAGQAVTLGQPGDVVMIATTNVRHLARFPGIDARHGATISYQDDSR